MRDSRSSGAPQTATAELADEGSPEAGSAMARSKQPTTAEVSGELRHVRNLDGCGRLDRRSDSCAADPGPLAALQSQRSIIRYADCVQRGHCRAPYRQSFDANMHHLGGSKSFQTARHPTDLEEQWPNILARSQRWLAISNMGQPSARQFPKQSSSGSGRPRTGRRGSGRCPQPVGEGKARSNRRAAIAEAR